MPSVSLALSLRRLANAGTTDAELLTAFRVRRDESAFAELVRRHAGLVAGVCRRVLGQVQDAEDAFQATFLVLARKAHAVTNPERLAGWLHTVAMRAAEEVRSMRARQRRDDSARPLGETISDRAPDADLAAVLDEELARLPDIYRLTVLHCELQGQSRTEAAAALKIPEGTLSSRLAEAKQRLARRLRQRGITAGAATIAAALAQRADAGMTASRIAGLARSAVALVAGNPAQVAGPALAVADVVIKSMFVSKLKCVVAAAVIAALIGGSFTLAPGGGGMGAALAGEPPAAHANPDPAMLVKMLGSAKFAEREDAQRQLIALGAEGRSAVRAGTADANAEVAKRCASILPRLTVEELKKIDHPAWVRFRKLVGDNEASRQLFLEMIDDPRRAVLLETAESNPDRAGDVYKTELDARVQAVMAGYREAERLYGNRSGILLPVNGVPGRGEFGTLLFLGTYATSAPVTFKQTNDSERVWHHSVFGLALADPRKAKAKPIASEIRRLFAAWLAVRTDPEPMRFGMNLALSHGMREALPVARAAAGNKDLAPEPKGFALLAVGQFGTTGDLPLLERSFADNRVFHNTNYTSVNNAKKEVETLVSDTAIASALRLRGEHPADYGYPLLAEYKERGPDTLAKYHLLGFFDAATRDAVHKKAIEWLAKQPPPEKEPDPAALIRKLSDAKYTEREDAQRKLRELGGAALPAVRDGIAAVDAETTKRCKTLLPLIQSDEWQKARTALKDQTQPEINHPIWQRFKEILGGDVASRKLFLDMITDEKRAKLLDEAFDAPEQAGGLYAAEIARVEKLVRFGGMVVGAKSYQLPNAELATLMFIGTLPATAKVVPNEGLGEQVVLEGSMFKLGLGGNERPAMNRLLAAWIPARGYAGPMEAGLDLGKDRWLKEILPVARKIAANEKRPAKVRAEAALAVGQLGDHEDIAPLRRIAESSSAAEPFDKFNIIVKGKEMFDALWGRVRLGGTKPTPEEWKKANDEAVIKYGSVSLADCAWAAAVHLAGGKPGDMGFLWRWQTSGHQTFFLPHVHCFGFETAEARQAAHAKAKDWLAKNPPGPKKAEPKAEAKEPTAELLRELDDFDKMRQGDGTKFAEVEKRGLALLAKYSDPADQARIYFQMVVIFGNSNINRTSARVTKFARLALQLERDPIRRAGLFSDLGSAAIVDPNEEEFEIRRRNATKVLLEGYQEVLPLKLPPVAPELPNVMKLSEGSDEADRQRHETQMKTRREAEFVREMVHLRDMLIRQMLEPYQLARAASAELKLKKAAADSADKILAKSIEVLQSTKDVYEAKQELYKKDKLTHLELVTAYIEMKRAEATVADSKANAAKARLELAKAQPVNVELRQLADEILTDPKAAAELLEKSRQ